MVTFWHSLPQQVSVHPDRKQFIAEYCRGRKVLHVGCTDAGLSRERINAQTHLHLKLLTTAERVWGLDIDEDGLELLRSMGVTDLYHANAEQLDELPLDDSPDLIVATEVLEHVSNPGLFLESLGKFGCEVLLTVPNAYSFRAIQAMQSGQEFVHEDHNYYFSYTTLKKLIEKHGFYLNHAAVYYWPSDDEVGRVLQSAMDSNPFFAEGLIFSIMPTSSDRQSTLGNAGQRYPKKIAFFAGDGDNFNFLRDIIAHYRDIGEDVRVVESMNMTPEQIFQVMQWSDVSWFEWGNGPLITASHLPKVCKIVARIHKYEVFSDSPGRINWPSVDELIFVSPKVLEIFKEKHRADIESVTKVSIIDNAVCLKKIAPAFKDRGFNIAYVNRINKDKNPALLIQVMAELVKRDRRFKCFIAGWIQDEVIYRYMQQMIDALNLREHIEFCGVVNDINSWLADKHYIFSTSVVEGHPVSVIEGMAKGLKPVIHNYLGDPASFVGERHVFNTIEEAVALFMEEDYQPQEYRQHIERHFSLDKQLERIDSIVLGEEVLAQSAYQFSRSFNIVLEDADPVRLAEAITAYLQAFSTNDDVELILLASQGIEQAYSVVANVLGNLGKSEDDIPDLTLEEVSASKRAELLRRVKLALGAPEFVAEARLAKCPALKTPTAEGLRLAKEILPRLDWNAEPLPSDHLAPERWLVSQPGAWRKVLPGYLDTITVDQNLSLLVRVNPGEAEAVSADMMAWIQGHGYDPDKLPDIVLIDDEVASELSVFRMATSWLDTGQPEDRLVAEALGLSIVSSDAAGMASFLSQPFISILIPTYNRASYIEEAVRSARMQDYDRFEVLVIDDGSTDNTHDIVLAIQDPRVKYLEKPHSGGPATRNVALLHANGDFVMWLGSDDVLEPGALSAYSQALRETPNVDVFYGDLLVTDANLNPVRLLQYEDWYGRSPELIAGFLEHNQIPDGGSLIRKKCYERAGDYDESFRRAHDYEWWSRLIGQAEFRRVARTVYRWRWHDGNMSSGTVKFDTSYDAAVVKGLIKRFSLQELCPGIDWQNLSRPQAEAQALLRVAIQLINYADLEGAREILRQSLERSPSHEASELASRLGV